MSKLIEITSDLLTTDIQYIAHQCNCISKRSAHLSKSMFEEFPYADVYTGRSMPDKLGTITVRGDGIDDRYVINMFGQFYPGRVKYPKGSKDNSNIRINAFKSCLEEVENIPGLFEIAFPYKIGCGAAGGNWAIYNKMLEDFSERVFPFVDVCIVKLKTSS